jgi:hypothetical protein
MDDVLIIKKVVKDGKPSHSGTYPGYPQRASLDPLLPDDTKSPRNRRISILLLRRKVSEKASAVKKAAETTARRTAKKKKPAPAAPKQD